MEIEEILSPLAFVPISPKAYQRFLELEEAEHQRAVESRLGTVKTDNIGVYRIRELKFRGFTMRKNGTWVSQDEYNSFSPTEISLLNDSQWFGQMDRLDNTVSNQEKK